MRPGPFFEAMLGGMPLTLRQLAVAAGIAWPEYVQACWLQADSDWSYNLSPGSGNRFTAVANEMLEITDAAQVPQVHCTGTGIRLMIQLWVQ